MHYKGSFIVELLTKNLFGGVWAKFKIEKIYAKNFDRLIHFIEKNSHSIITYSSIGKYFLSLALKKIKYIKL